MKPKPTPPSGSSSPRKRLSPPTSSIPSPSTQRPTFTAPSSPRRRSSAGGQISRSISACNRCRSRKTKCDQLFPSCTSCAKAGVECVGIDAATGREVPRSYVDWLEKRVKFLEGELGLVDGGGGMGMGAGTGMGAGVGLGKRKLSAEGDGGEVERRRRSESGRGTGTGSARGSVVEGNMMMQTGAATEDKALHLRPDIENLVSQVGLVSVQGTSSPGFVGGSSGISFARLMFAAVKLNNRGDNNPPSQPSNSATSSIKSAPSTSPNATTESTTTAADSATPNPRQRVNPEPFPPRHIGEQYIDIYFNLANPQTPILHRPSFTLTFQRAYAYIEQRGGGSVGLDPHHHSDPAERENEHHADLYSLFMVYAIAAAMNSRNDNLPERYHASAIVHLDALFNSISYTNNRLEGLKGTLLLALYSIMRPAAPGVWYVLGTALRLAIDLGLHQENTPRAERTWDPLTIDERRRLWWSTYALDRQLGLYLGRPFGVADDAIRTPLPVEELEGWLDQGEGVPAKVNGKRSCRTIFIHVFRIRQIQSEIQQVLYQSSSSLPRRFANVDEWRKDVEDRLREWCVTVPKTNEDTNCGYNLGFIELNYEQTRLLLYGLCPTVPHPSVSAFETIFESGEKIIRLYSRLLGENCINYTWLACHNLFMAGTSYLCAIWHCAEVRRQTTIDRIEHHAQATVNILSSMISRCPAAQGCRDVFESLAKATIDLYRTELARERESSKRVKTEASSWTPPYAPPQSLPASLANIVHAHEPYPVPQQQQQHMPPLLQGYEMMPPPAPLQGDQQQQQQGMFMPQEMIAECMNMDGLRVFEMMQQIGGSGEWDGGAWAGGGYGSVGDAGLFVSGWSWL
ncbi:uncharacterized protein LAJ45_09654 [Morchella importuna]|uniref:uncharacterized protein n=1 Tax=Morchella importuna TaxID=1174673 RepID=UPI001E8D840A|nr:uncharacterized protein LAJ45_09654 [Morchella importuna]KAH8146212.1 hypothetical protein LAJ45_09654 [Morchella importuna]